MFGFLKVAKALRRFRREEDGNTTVEFVIIFPAFIAIFLSSFEAGIMMVRNVMLERGVDIAVRELRLGLPVAPTYDEIKQAICDNAVIFPDCATLVQVELQPIDTATWAPLTGAANCINESVHNNPVNPINPIVDTTFVGGGNNELMIVRVCALFTPFFPGTTLGMQMPRFDPADTSADAKYALVVTSAFVNEPTR